MAIGNKIGRFAIAATVIAFGPLMAQEIANDQADVWSTIERQWEAEQQGHIEWVDDMLVENFAGWAKNAPAPRNKASTRMWSEFQDHQGKTLEHELYPLSIIVYENVAIAHYLYTSAFQKKNGEVEVNNGRFTDILVRTEDGWKFLSWHGGDD